MSYAKEVKKFVRELERRGWVLDRYTGTGHVKMTFTNGLSIVISKSPNCPFWQRKAQRDAERAEQGAEYAGFKRDEFCGLFL